MVGRDVMDVVPGFVAVVAVFVADAVMGFPLWDSGSPLLVSLAPRCRFKIVNRLVSPLSIPSVILASAKLDPHRARPLIYAANRRYQLMHAATVFATASHSHIRSSTSDLMFVPMATITNPINSPNYLDRPFHYGIRRAFGLSRLGFQQSGHT